MNQTGTARGTGEIFLKVLHNDVTILITSSRLNIHFEGLIFCSILVDF